MAPAWSRLLETARWNLSRHRGSTFLSLLLLWLTFTSLCFAMRRFVLLWLASLCFTLLCLDLLCFALPWFSLLCLDLLCFVASRFVPFGFASFWFRSIRFASLYQRQANFSSLFFLQCSWPFFVSPLTCSLPFSHLATFVSTREFHYPSCNSYRGVRSFTILKLRVSFNSIAILRRRLWFNGAFCLRYNTDASIGVNFRRTFASSARGCLPCNFFSL